MRIRYKPSSASYFTEGVKLTSGHPAHLDGYIGGLDRGYDIRITPDPSSMDDMARSLHWLKEEDAWRIAEIERLFRDIPDERDRAMIAVRLMNSTQTPVEGKDGS